MGARAWPMMIHCKQMLHRFSVRSHKSTAAPDVPRGHFAVYVGEEKTKFVVPITYLKHPLFQNLLKKTAEEFGFRNPGGCLRVLCEEDDFISITSQMTGRRC